MEAVTGRLAAALTLVLPLVLARGAAGAAPADAVRAAACPRVPAGAGYWQRVDRALRARQDVWGNALLRAPSGPTYAAARRYLRPLLLARTAGQRPLTAS